MRTITVTLVATEAAGHHIVEALPDDALCDVKAHAASEREAVAEALRGLANYAAQHGLDEPF